MTEIKKNKITGNRYRKSQLIFYICVVTLPILNFFVLNFFKNYIYTIILSFQKYDNATATYVFQSELFSNYKTFIQSFFSPDFLHAAGNSLIIYALTWITMPVSFFVSIYLVKDNIMVKYYRVVLLLPSIVASMVWALLYKYIVDRAIPRTFDTGIGLLSNINTRFWGIWLYTQWLNLAGGFLMVVGIFSGVSPEIIDAGKIDGLGLIGELLHVYFPSYYPIWIVSIYSGVLSIFMGQFGYEFYEESLDSSCHTIGYKMFVMAVHMKVPDDMCINAAGSVVFTLFSFPVIMGLKTLLERIGPSEDEVKPLFKRRKV